MVKNWWPASERSPIASSSNGERRVAVAGRDRRASAGHAPGICATLQVGLGRRLDASPERGTLVGTDAWCGLR